MPDLSQVVSGLAGEFIEMLGSGEAQLIQGPAFFAGLHEASQEPLLPLGAFCFGNVCLRQA